MHPSLTLGTMAEGILVNLHTHTSLSDGVLPPEVLARRLAERGVRFINIVHASWDQHSELDKNHGYSCGAVDQPIALHDADGKSGEVEVAGGIHARHFGGFTAEINYFFFRRAPQFPTPGASR